MKSGFAVPMPTLPLASTIKLVEAVPTTRVVEAKSEPPPTLSPLVKVEEAVEIKPPEEFRVNTVLVPDWLMLVRVRASPV
jgi:hypothetical protein